MMPACTADVPPDGWIRAVGHCRVLSSSHCAVERVTWPGGDQDPSRIHAGNLFHSLLVILEDHMLTAQVPQILRSACCLAGVI